jgi:hypothetical protein
VTDIEQLPIPDWGLRCPHCDQPLAGMREHRCQGCGREFNIRKVLADHRPIPDIGAKCPACRHLLTGLTGSTCPECGETFSLRAILSRAPARPVLSFDTFADPPDHHVKKREPQWSGRERPLPDFGLCCPGCEHALSGAADDACPHCGQSFHPSAHIPTGEFVDISRSIPPRVFSHAKAILYEAQVPYIVDEPGFSLAYGVHTPFGRSKLRVPREFFFDALYCLVAAAHMSAEADEAWKCPSCSEVVPAGFEVCWSCGAPHP